MHRRIAGAREVAEIGLLREEVEDRFGPLPQPLENLLLLQTARIKLGQAGASSVSFKGGRLAVTPVELNLAQVRALRATLPEAIYESGRSQLSLRVAGEPAAQFEAVVRAADALLSVLVAAAAEPAAA